MSGITSRVVMDMIGLHKVQNTVRYNTASFHRDSKPYAVEPGFRRVATRHYQCGFQAIPHHAPISMGILAVPLKMPECGTMFLLLHRLRGRPGFDVGYKAARGIPRTSHLVNPTGNAIVANDDNYALAA